jgi:putative effector of murein hydrolase
MALLLLALIAIGSIVALLLLTGTAYRTYFETAAWIHFILGPATVALAIPLYKNIGEIRRSTLAIGAAVAAGAITASGSAMDSRNSSDIGYLRPLSESHRSEPRKGF